MGLTQVSTSGIKDATVATADIADDAVTTAKLAAHAVTNAKLADGSVDSASLTSNSVTTVKITDGNVTTAKIADNAVTTAKVADGQITNAKIAGNTIAASRIVAGGLTSATLANDSVITDKIADQAVTLAKLPHGTSSNDGKFLRANNGADPSFETVRSRVGRNVIVNGAMQVAQRGTSFTNISNTGVIGSVDRMIMVGAGLDELAFAGKQTSDGPDGFKKCFEFDVTTAESALNANDLAYIRYKVEGQDLVSFYNANGTGKNFVLSFYVKAYQAGTYQLNIYKPTGTRFISKTYSIASSGVWQRVEVPITGDTNTSGINDDNGAGLNIAWMLVAGTDYTSAGVLPNWGGWPGNSGFAGGQAVNVASSTDNYFRITGIQLELGDTATDFEHRSFADELLKCQRYYENVKGASFNNSNEVLVANGFNYTTSRCIGNFQFKVEKRARPSTSTDDASEVQVLKSDAGWYSSGSFGGNSNKHCTRLDCTSIAGSPMVEGQGAEIRLINDGIIHFDAEL